MINKVVNSIKKDGIFKTGYKILRILKRKMIKQTKSKTQKLFDDLININEFDTIIVFENNFGWNKIMKQRPQQIAEHIPQKTLMFYHSDVDNEYNTKQRITKLKDNIILLDLGYYRTEMFEFLANHYNKYLMVYSTDYIPYERIKMYEEYGYELIYEYVDDINRELSGEEMYNILTERHTMILKDNPNIICTATKLYDQIEKKDNCILISNGGDYEHFKSNEHSIPNELLELKNKHKYLVCYYGALASWFDYALIKKIATDEEIGIILIGQDYDSTLEKSGILEHKNIYYLGKKNYEDLPKYGHNIDTFMIPFVINEITNSTSPVKLFEYMAMGKPIVTTNLPECRKYESVLCSKDEEEFIKNIYKSFELSDNKKYLKLLEQEAKENTWDSKAKEMINFINERKYSKLQKEISDILNKNDYERIVLWRSPFGWNVPLFQRPQHIANNLSKNKCLVFYEVTPNTDFVKTIKKEQENLYLVNFHNYYIKDILHNILYKEQKPKYLQIYSTNWSMSMEELNEYEKNGFKILYEYIDDISPDLAGTEEIPPYIIDKYNYAMKNKEVLIVTTAKELYNDVERQRGKTNLAFSCNGVDYNFFKKIDSNYKIEHNISKIISNGKINLCYYGALASWFDYELIEKINDTNLYNIMLFGIKYDDSFDNSKVNNLKNVHFFGPKDYKVLKNYASKMDILTIPFIINSITQATSPLKLFEYMALKKPIITTAMNECKNYQSVIVGENHEDFINKLEKCIKLKNDKKYLKLLEKEAKENDWSKKAEIIIDLFKQSERKK